MGTIYIRIKKGKPTEIIGGIEDFGDFIQVLSGCTSDEVKCNALCEFSSKHVEQFDNYMCKLEEDILAHKITVEV